MNLMVCLGLAGKILVQRIFTELKNENNLKSEIKGFLDFNEDDRCKNYFYYLRFLIINLRNKE